MDTTPEPAGYGHAATLAPLAHDTIAAMTPADYLTALGGTPDEVAATLRRLDITGIPLDSGRCPVANYLREYAGMRRPSLTQHAVRDGDVDLGRPPAAVAGFLNSFDQRYFPDLITPADDTGTGY